MKSAPFAVFAMRWASCLFVIVAITTQENGLTTTDAQQVCVDSNFTAHNSSSNLANIVIDVENECATMVGVFRKPSSINWRITGDPSVSAIQIHMTPEGVVEPFTKGGELHFRYGMSWSGSADAGVEIVVPPGLIQKAVVGGLNTTLVVTLGNETEPSIIDIGKGNIVVLNALGTGQFTQQGQWGFAYITGNLIVVSIVGDDGQVSVKAPTTRGLLGGSYNQLLIESPAVFIQGTGDNVELLLNGEECVDPYWQDRGRGSSCRTVTDSVTIPDFSCTASAVDATLDCSPSGSSVNPIISSLALLMSLAATAFAVLMA